MELSTAIRTVITTFRRRPADFLPFYILGLAVPGIVRVASFLGLAVLFAYLYTSGRIDLFIEELGMVDMDPPDPETDPEAFLDWAETFQPVVESVVTFTSVSLLALTLAVTVLGMIILSAAVTAGQIGAVYATLRSERGNVGGIAAFRQYWLSFVGLYLIELFLFFMISAILLGLVAVAAFVSLAVAIFVAIFAVLFWLGLVLVIRAIFAFAPVAIVVDDTGVFGSLRSSVGFIRHEFMSAVSYYVVAVAVLMGFAGFSSTMAFIGAPTITAVLSFLLITPALDLLKTTFFGAYRDAINPPAATEDGIVTQTKRGIHRGLREMGSFVRETVGLHLLAVGTMVIGFGMGWVIAEPLVGELETSIAARIEGIIPPTAALEFFGNNWMVAMVTAFSGVAAGIPAAVSLWFNGLVFAIVARLEVSMIELVAFVLPHGIIEIPAILIAGALGYYLGIETWRAWRGRINRRAFADTLERSFWIVIGIGILIAIAAFIEGFISPFYFRLFL